MRITCLIHAIKCGGAERVMSTICNYWCEQEEHDVHLLTLDNGSVAPFYPLHVNLNHTSLKITSESANISQAILSNIHRIITIRAAILDTRPDAVVSFLPTTNILSILATMGLNIPTIVCEHHYPPLAVLSPLWKGLRPWVYPYATRVTVLTEEAIACFAQNIQCRSSVLPNPVTVSPPSDEIVSLPSPTLVAMGRLVHQKGFDNLLQAFATVFPKHPTWHLVVLGEGPLRHELETLCQKLGIEDHVSLIGNVKNPHDYLRAAELYVLTSRHEGFPMALCEAMACGLPVIATNCPSGPAEIIRHGIDGLLVPNNDVSALGEAMETLMDQANIREQMAKKAPDILHRFGLSQVMQQWSRLLAEVVVQ